MIIDNANNILGMMVCAFMDEVDRIMKERSDIFTPDVMKMFRFRKLSSVGLFCDQLIRHKPSKTRYSPKQIFDNCMDFLNKHRNVPFMAEVSYHIEDNTIKIDNIYITIDLSVLCEDTLYNIHMLDKYIEIVKLHARHEVGHLIDYLTNMDGYSLDVYTERATKEIKLFEEYLDWCDSNDDFEDQSRRYFELPQERRADICGNVDRDRYYELAFPKGKDYTTSIEITPIYDKG